MNDNDTQYGEFWIETMLKWSKVSLVNFIRDLLIEKQQTPQNIVIRPCDDCIYNDTFDNSNKE